MPTNADYQKAKDFLEAMKPLLKTKQCTFKVTDKNKALRRKYALLDNDCIRIIRALQPSDLAAIDESRKSSDRSEAYIFFRVEKLDYYGEEIDVELYVKLCIEYTKFGDWLIVWSIHEEGMHNT